MIDVSRRLFLGGVATAISVRPSPGRAAVPILYGTGTHDDAPALNAWMRGDPIRVLDDDLRIAGDGYKIVGAQLLVGSTIMAREIPLALDQCVIRAMDTLEGEVISLNGDHRIGGIEVIAGQRTTYAVSCVGGTTHIDYIGIDMRRAKAYSAAMRIDGMLSQTSAFAHDDQYELHAT